MVLKNIRLVLLHLFWKLSVDDEGGSSSLIKLKSGEGRENLSGRAEDEKEAKRHEDRWKFGGLKLCICSSFISAEQLLSAPYLRLPLIRLMLTPASLLHCSPLLLHGPLHLH